jgi:fibronectin type 3 domain-containing protein
VTGTGVAAAHYVTLGWTASTSTVTGYNVYRSTTSGTNYVQINPALVKGLSYTDDTVQGSTTYYYVVTSVDSQGVESTDSNMATAIVP